MSSLSIRAEQPGDAAAVDAVIAAAFAGKPYSSGSEVPIARALRQTGAATVALVAAQAGKILGQAQFSPVTIDGKPSAWHALGPVAVRPARQGEGIGSRLIEEGLARLRAVGSAGCVLTGDPGYYKRFGFAHTSRLVMPEYPPEDFLILAFAEDIPTGIVAFHPAFDAT